MRWFLALLLGLWVSVVGAAPFNHSHRDWDALLSQHVRWINDGVASQVDYRGFAGDRARLKRYLATLSAVSRVQFDQWSNDQQLAFLINAYNAWTIELVLTEYPNLSSIKDLGTWLQSPWKIVFFELFGRSRHLDYIEHELIRQHYKEPLIHFALVCASVGCPALRDRAFVAERLEHQLVDGVQRFLADSSRNSYDQVNHVLRASKLFDWYREDFERGERGLNSIIDVFLQFSVILDVPDEEKDSAGRPQVGIEFTAYDWALNDLG